MNKVSIQCRNICLGYGATEVLKNLSLDIHPGEFFALLGPSGSGKSSLLRLIAGFNHHQSGQLFIDGKEVSGQAPWERQVGMVFQSYALWPHLSVWDNVAFGLVERKVERDILKSKVSAILSQVELLDLAYRKPSQLSGGQQQRVALARTLVVEPKVLLLDEPLSNLDKTLRIQMRQELLSLQRRLGITTIFVTHDQEEAMSTADRMAVLEKGVVQQVGSPEDLYHSPANSFVANFVGTMNVVSVSELNQSHANWSALQSDNQGEIASKFLSFRPHDAQLVAAESMPTSVLKEPMQTWLPGIVLSAEFMGHATRYKVRMSDTEIFVDQSHGPEKTKWHPNDRVSIGLKPAQVRWLY